MAFVFSKMSGTWLGRLRFDVPSKRKWLQDSEGARTGALGDTILLLKGVSVIDARDGFSGAKIKRKESPPVLIQLVTGRPGCQAGTSSYTDFP